MNFILETLSRIQKSAGDEYFTTLVNKSTDTKQNSPKKRKVDKLLGWGLVSKAAYFQSEITQKSWSRWCVNTLMREHVDASIFFLVSLDALAH